MKNIEGPIAVLDSGVGGLTVASTLQYDFPDEHIVYVGDEDYGRYGNLSLESIRCRVLALTESLVEQARPKLICLACNTAGAATARDIRERFMLPVVSMPPAASRAAAEATKNKNIGVLATAATVTAGVYEEYFAAMGEYVIESVACPDLAELVEKGEINTTIVHDILAEALEPLMRRPVDTIVLGCTHYPFLQDAIASIAGPNVSLVSGVQTVARDVSLTLGRGRAHAPAGRRVVRRCMHSTSRHTSLLSRAQFYVEISGWQEGEPLEVGDDEPSPVESSNSELEPNSHTRPRSTT